MTCRAAAPAGHSVWNVSDCLPAGGLSCQGTVRVSVHPLWRHHVLVGTESPTLRFADTGRFLLDGPGHSPISGPAHAWFRGNGIPHRPRLFISMYPVPVPAVGCERHEGGVSHLSGVSRAPRGAWHNEGAWLEMGFGLPRSFLPSSCLLCWHLGLHIRSSAHLSGASVPGMLPDSKAG